MTQRARLVGINHVALEVGDLESAVAFYDSLFAIRAVTREPRMAFVDMGDQFLALSEGRSAPRDDARHFGLVVDDKQLVRATLRAAGVETFGARSLNFRDPWGNFVQVVDYRDIMFTKAPEVLAGMALDGARQARRRARRAPRERSGRIGLVSARDAQSSSS
jgi:catechol 2,3-dioxygenase-like lactoylglutathione lyase family enzyme